MYDRASRGDGSRESDDSAARSGRRRTRRGFLGRLGAVAFGGTVFRLN